MLEKFLSDNYNLSILYLSLTQKSGWIVQIEYNNALTDFLWDTNFSIQSFVFFVRLLSFLYNLRSL